MSVEKVTTATRMPAQLREQLEARASDNGRSLSGEILYRLRKSLEQEQKSEQERRA